jgi:DNA adenine methylase
LVNLFRVVRNNLDNFKSRQYFLLSSREEYYSFMQAMKKEKFKDNIDRAIAFFYLIKNSFGSRIFSGWAFGPARGPKYRVSLDKLEAASERLENVYIDNLSFERLIPNWDRKDTLFYCDPPMQCC